MALSELDPLTPEELEEVLRSVERAGGHRGCDPTSCFYAYARQIIPRMAEELRAYKQLFDLQHKRTIEADRLWQAAHNQPDVFPDLGELIGWLLKQAGTGRGP